ncbi:MAG: RagB/SusD family nutrient uptake outer membrane protein [Bacteroidales bacterium]|nr:RagB/SusD family nutrient uptake outer membrane protein [Bacteroidales bacterium]
MKTIKWIVAAVIIVSVLLSCSEDWLKPEPLSFYTPENTYVNVAGFESALLAAEANMRLEFATDGDKPSPLSSDLWTSDVAAYGSTDQRNALVDFDNYCLPSTAAIGSETNQIKRYWSNGYEGIKYANIPASRIDNITWESESAKNAILAAAYFQRAYRYYKLVHQFGDVPYLSEELTEPKTDFYTNDRWSILETIYEDLEFSYQWANDNVDRGKTNKDAVGVLLMKVCMCLCKWDRAIELGNEIVAKHPLMTKRFGNFQGSTNLMTDLFNRDAKLDPSNTEGILYVVSYPETEGSVRFGTMRLVVPYWASNAIITPDGQKGTQYPCAEEDRKTYLDNDYNVGRGVGKIHPSDYYATDIWGEKEKNDLRGPLAEEHNWRATWELYYNHSSLKKKKSEYYGQHIQYPTGMLVSDSVRCWYAWPHYKMYVPDPSVVKDIRGGETPWYVYRSAEVYLMLAECYYWKDDFTKAAEMLNIVRVRAKADPITANDINIGAILDERARELFYEEARHIELVRISYTYAKTGRPCEVFGGHVYKLDNFSGPAGVGVNVKEMGYNFWYDWVVTHNNFYRDNINVQYGTYRISVHHVLWPIPESAITTNTGGHINQNIGYPGSEDNIIPLKVGESFIK